MQIRPEDYLSIPEMEALGYVPTWGRNAALMNAGPEPSKLYVRQRAAPSNVIRVDFGRRVPKE